ncbi:MAG: tetratricopeptide repeat protein [Alphaproteobacteria bacterium]|nr:tetratricopeptide repeat protein [Alphaproteobacteria bacterium]
MRDGRAGLVLQAWRHAIVRAPASAPAYLALAKLLPPADAFRVLGRADALAGTSSGVARAFARAAFAVDRAPRARAILSAALARESRADTLTDLGIVEARLGFDGASRRFRQAIVLDPGLAAAHFALGNRGDQAERRYRPVLARDPHHDGALVNLANLWRDGPRLKESIGLLERAVALAPGDAIALYNLASARHIAGDADAAAGLYRAALAIEPRPAWRLREATLLPPIPGSAEEITVWRRRFARRVEALTAVPIRVDDPLGDGHWTSFHLAYHDEDDRPLQEAVARLWRHAAPSLAGSDLRRHDGRPRLGFVSAYFRDHTIGHLFKRVNAGIDRARFQVVVVRAGPATDAVAEAIAACADEVVTLPEDLPTARQHLAGACLDALVYTDVGMDPFTYYLAHARLAPLQMVAWGHPVTTGLDTIDLFLSADVFERDGAEAGYTEELARLPFLLLDWQPETVDLAGAERSRLGLAADGRAYLCAQSLFKLHPSFDRVLAEILDRDQAAVLHFVEGHRRPWCRRIAQRLECRFAGAIDRIRFLPRLSGADFIRAQALADVVLDTPGFSGGKTSLEAFAVGQPVVTMASRYLRGRLTYGFYRRMGLDDLVATSLDDYVAKAVRLGTDLGFRADARGRVAERSKRLWGTVESVRAFEDLVANRLSRRAARPS